MLYIKELKDILGEHNMRAVIESIRRGQTNHQNIKMIAIQMNAYGVMSAKSRDHDLEDVFRDILDFWYNDYLCDHEESGLQDFIDILNSYEVNLRNLALKLRRTHLVGVHMHLFDFIAS